MKKESILKFWLFVLSLVLVASFVVQAKQPSDTKASISLPAFPGAEGFGSNTPGGRYGKIIFVTNLNDTTNENSSDYPGSLRWALTHTWPENPNDPFGQRRIIIFRTGGTIKLVDKIVITHPYVTIAGQTAPGDGIVLRGDQLTIATHDVIVRGIRVRVGDEGTPTCCRDGINISTTNADNDVYNIIVDHSSVSWAIDENVSTWTASSKPYKTHDITIQWSIISEALHNSIHIDEGSDVTDPHSMGMLIGQDGYNVSIHHNLFANNWGRNPRISGMVASEVVNNIMYGWGDAAVEISKDKNVTHILNNFFIGNSASSEDEISISKSINPQGRIYIEGNVTENASTRGELVAARIHNPSEFPLASSFVFEPSDVDVSSSEAAYANVLAYAGAISPMRDEVDRRVVNNVINRTGQIIDSQDQVGGWPLYQSGQYPPDTDNDGIPDSWELAHGLDMYSAIDANNPNILAPSGYTWLEEYTNSLLHPLTASSSNPPFFDVLKNLFSQNLGFP